MDLAGSRDAAPKKGELRAPAGLHGRALALTHHAKRGISPHKKLRAGRLAMPQPDYSHLYEMTEPGVVSALLKLALADKLSLSSERNRGPVLTLNEGARLGGCRMRTEVHQGS